MDLYRRVNLLAIGATNIRHIPGFRFLGYTSIVYCPQTNTPRRYMVYKSETTEEIIKGPIIYEGDPDWNIRSYIEV